MGEVAADRTVGPLAALQGPKDRSRTAGQVEDGRRKGGRKKSRQTMGDLFQMKAETLPVVGGRAFPSPTDGLASTGILAFGGLSGRGRMRGMR
jgi:hypothetical protein